MSGWPKPWPNASPAACFEDARVHTVRVRVEKLEALTDAESVGIEIERTR